jgi:hypothetical protein
MFRIERDVIRSHKLFDKIMEDFNNHSDNIRFDSKMETKTPVLNIFLNEKEIKIFKKISNLFYFKQLLSQGLPAVTLTFVGKDDKETIENLEKGILPLPNSEKTMMLPTTINFLSDSKKEKFKIVVTYTEDKKYVPEPDVSKNIIPMTPKEIMHPKNFKLATSNEQTDKKPEPVVNKNVVLKTTTQKYLNMNHKLIELRDAMFDPNVKDEIDEPEEVQQKVIDALDELCHYLDDYKANNGVKTKIKE